MFYPETVEIRCAMCQQEIPAQIEVDAHNYGEFVCNVCGNMLHEYMKQQNAYLDRYAMNVAQYTTLEGARMN